MTDSDPLEQKKSHYEQTDPDVRLMIRVRKGDNAAFQELVEKYQARLVGILTHMVSNRDLAEDLAQDVFLRVYRARERYVPTAKFSTWLFTITHNVASNALRKASRRREINLVSTSSSSMPVRPLEVMAKEKSGLMPTRQLLKSEMENVMLAAIEQLGERQRIATMLSKFEGMSYLEIGEAMGLSTQAVKSLLSRARSNLKEILRPYLESGGLVESVATELKTDQVSEEDK